MAVILRLARHGKKGAPFYRIVAAEKENKRDGKFIDVIGTYNPMTDPITTTLKEDIIKKWLGVGAQPTESVASIIKKNFPGLLEARIDHQRKKTQEKRSARKKRAKAKTKKA